MEKNYILKAWNGILSGELPHDQETFSRGTTMCLLGWAIYLEAEDMGVLPGMSREDAYRNEYAVELVETLAGPGQTLWGFASDHYGLSALAVNALFDGDSSLEYQYETLLSLYGDDTEVAYNPEIAKAQWDAERDEC